jgi:GNAT superfamily N-acetyltransferase
MTEMHASPGSAMKATAAEPRFTDIGPDDPRLSADILPVLRELRPHLTAESLTSIYAEGFPQGLRFTGAYLNGTCLAVAGWRIVATTFCGRKLTIDDFVTAATARSLGLGRALLAELHQRARAADCQLLDLDSATHRADAHRFYMREHMSIGAFHFITQLLPRPGGPRIRRIGLVMYRRDAWTRLALRRSYRRHARRQAGATSVC